MKILIKNCVKKSWLAALGLSLIATPAFAHPGEHTTGFWAGFVHPFTGLDHLVAMMLLGVWFALLTRRMAIKSGLASVGIFALALLIGGQLIGGQLPENSIAAIEWAVLFSGLAVALLILFRMQLGQLAPVVAATLMATHGLVHGTEVTGNLIGYALGACVGMLVLVSLAYAATRVCLHIRAKNYSPQ